MVQYLVAALVGYLLGSIHPSYYFGKKIKNVDIREHGSKNSGTSNATIVLGWKYGVLTAVIDVLKGMFAVYIMIWIYGYIPPLLYFAALCAILGHMFPFYMNFRGGKGLATLMGVMIGINFWLTLVLFISLIIVTLVTDYIVLGTAFVCICFFSYTVVRFGISIPALIAMIMVFTILFKHRNNYKKIFTKEEIKFSSTLKKKSK